MAALLAVFAEFEREILRERVRSGLAPARQNGKKLGRPVSAGLQADRVRRHYRTGVGKSVIALRLQIGRTSVRRILYIEESLNMPSKKSAVSLEIYQLKVTLLGTNPPIWRRLLVPADLTLAQLHEVLQAAMGWEDDHMHEFSIGQRRFRRPDPEDRLMGMPSVENERTVRLSSILGRVGAKAIYTYDFGDSWEHGIVLEKRLSADPNTPYPVCTGGQLACPPEDCGGIGGFYNLLDAIGDPAHGQHEELRDWVGDDYDPEAFSIDNVNRMLTPLHRRLGKAPRN